MCDADVCAGGQVYVCALTHVSVGTQKARSCGHMSSFSALHLKVLRQNLLDLAVLACLQVPWGTFQSPLCPPAP